MKLGRKAQQKTFKPKKKYQKGTRRYDLHKQAQASLGISQNLRTAVKLPPGEDLNEWLAVHSIDFFNQTNLLYGSIDEFCDETECTEMRAGPQYVYLWASEEVRFPSASHVKKDKRPRSVSARKYVDLLFTWVQSKFDNEEIFPTTVDKPFPKDFKNLVCTIFKRLFRVFAHIYVHHFHRIQELDEEAHLNAVFKHFIFFVQEFELIDDKELAPLAELIEKFTGIKPKV